METLYEKGIITSLKSEFKQLKGIHLMEKYNYQIIINRIEHVFNVLSDLIEPVILSKYYVQNVVNEYNIALDYLLMDITDTIQVAIILNYVHNKLQSLSEFCIEYKYYEICENIKRFNQQL